MLLTNSITSCFASVSSPDVKMTVRGLFGEKSCIQAIGMLLIDLTSRAPTAISATISLDVRPFNAARDLVTPARLMSGGSRCAFVASIRNSATPIDALQRFRHFYPMCGENNGVALGRLLPGPRVGVLTEIGDKISQCLSASGIGYNDGATSVYQVTAERTRHVPGS